MPKVTIGMPVYNGARYLREALEGLQRQTYSDFEVLICENASSEDSLAIAQDFANSDKRFRVVASAATIPAWDNFARCLELSDSAYFAWRAYDDYSSNNFIAVLAEGLDAAPYANLAICDSHTLHVGNGRERRFAAPALAGASAAIRRQLLNHVRAQWFYGLYRREAITPVFNDCHAAYHHEWASDHAMLYPFLVGPQVWTTNDAWFTQRTGFDRDGKKFSPQQERRIFAAYMSFCSQHLEKADLPRSERLLLKARLPLEAHRHAFRMTRLLRRAIAG